MKLKSGAQNRVVDVLSRIAKLLGVLKMDVVSFDALKDLYTSDPNFANIFQEV